MSHLKKLFNKFWRLTFLIIVYLFSLSNQQRHFRQKHLCKMLTTITIIIRRLLERNYTIVLELITKGDRLYKKMSRLLHNQISSTGLFSDWRVKNNYIFIFCFMCFYASLGSIFTISGEKMFVFDR